MIGHLRGRLAAKHPPALVVDVGGVGYECEAPMSTFYQLPATGAEVTLYTHLVVREDAQLLYAFGTEQERRLFRSLLKVSGVGPKIALGILSGINVDGFLLCIEAQDADQLVRIPGVGRKTAERLLIEMRDRVKEFGATGAAGVAPVAGEGGSAQQEAYSALVALGYRPAEVVKLLKSVAQEGATTEDLIRRALQSAAG
ncbi:MAG: Holliday junction branch migration protein RuvA [Steroidobacteraceae bacterium]|jgi:Holliday junction DNA helicase RuvA|nr:Holliday junction branch migration protein RuvA [Steroidobacteraceae bacterium]